MGAALVPNAPVPVSFLNSVATSVTVAGYDQTYMTVWTCQGESVCFVVSTDNGTTWTLPNGVNSVSYTIHTPWIAGNASGFVVVYVAFSIGAGPGELKTTFTSDLGTSWNSAVTIAPSAFPPATITATTSGFLVTWWKDTTIFASFSPDGQSWTPPVTIDDSSSPINPGVQPIATGSGDNFMVTWTATNGSGFSAFSNDRGQTWTKTLIDAVFFVDGVPLWPSVNTDGFMVTTKDNSGTAYYSFSSNNGATWSTPLPITSGAQTTHYDAFPSVGSDWGFLSAGHFSDNSGQISLSTNDGGNWNAFVPFTAGFSMENTIIYDNFPCIAVGSQGCMAVWVDDNDNAISCFIPRSQPTLPVRGLSGTNLTNRFPFQRQYYNQLSWQASPSKDVVGYNIFRNGTFFAGTSGLSYVDQTVAKHTTYTYTIVAHTSTGATSTGVSITITVP